MSTVFASLAQADAIGGMAICVIYFALVVLLVAGMWATYAKAGQPGWGAIVPILNIYLLCKIAGRPGWWVILAFIPLVNLVIMIILYLDFAKSFGRGAGTAIGLLLLPFVFFPIIGFGADQYQGPQFR